MKSVLLILTICFAINLTSACQIINPNSQEDDFKKLEEMEEQILAIINTSNSGDIYDCRYIGIGAKACGGPTKFFVYAAQVTDTLLLFEKVEEHRDFQRELNTKYGIISTCDITQPPTLGLDEGHCVDLDAR